MKLIIKCDDLGWTEGVNAGFEKVARDGLMTCAGAMPNMKHFEQGIEMMKKYPHICVGQHTDLMSGQPVADPKLIPHLVDDKGEFLSTKYYRSLPKDETDSGLYADEYYIEIKAQVDKFIRCYGKKPAFLEGHAAITRAIDIAMARVAEEYDIINTHDRDNLNRLVYFPGIAQEACEIFRDDDKMKQFSRSTLPYVLDDQGGWMEHDTSMLLFHPGYVDAPLMGSSSFHGVRMRDVETLCSSQLKQFIKQHDIELISFNDLKEER